MSLLGVVSIVAYGTWYYAFGVLLDPILLDTSWSETWVTGSYSGSAGIGAILAPHAGRLADQFSVKHLLVAAATGTSVGFSVAALATSAAVFLAGSLVGGVSLSGLAFYHVTQTAAIRLAPDEPARAAGLVTLFGAFAATVYLPLTAQLVALFGWRTTMHTLSISSAMVLIFVASVCGQPQVPDEPPSTISMSNLFSSNLARRYAFATAWFGVASGIVLVYQVPLMISAGLTVTAAASIAAGRGVAQFAGRLPIVWLTRSIGTRRSLQLAFGSLAVGIVLLAVARHPAIAVAYVLAAGFGIGATSPLQGIYAAELFDHNRLGHALGITTMILGMAAAAGPLVVAILSDLTGSRWWAIAIAIPAATIAALLMNGDSPRRFSR